MKKMKTPISVVEKAHQPVKEEEEEEEEEEVRETQCNVLRQQFSLTLANTLLNMLLLLPVSLQTQQTGQTRQTRQPEK